MTIQVELSTAAGIKGFFAPRVEEICKEKLHQNKYSGWVHLHLKPLKEQNKGIQKIQINARTSIDNKRIVAKAEGFGIEPTVKDVLNKVTAQLAY